MANLPAKLSDLAKNLQAAAASSGSTGEGVFMKFNKGTWEYGQESQEIEAGSQWAVHPEGLFHGWIAWGDEAHGNPREKLGEHMCPASVPNKSQAELPDVAGSWSRQYGIQMLCISGIDRDLKVMFTTSTTGGQKFYQGLLKEIINKLNQGSPDVCPIIMLEVDSYTHKKYGKTFVPEFSVVNWLTLEDLQDRITSAEPDDEIEEEEVEEVVAPTPPPATRARRARRG